LKSDCGFAAWISIYREREVLVPNKDGRQIWLETTSRVMGNISGFDRERYRVMSVGDWEIAAE